VEAGPERPGPPATQIGTEEGRTQKHPLQGPGAVDREGRESDQDPKEGPPATAGKILPNGGKKRRGEQRGEVETDRGPGVEPKRSCRKEGPKRIERGEGRTGVRGSQGQRKGNTGGNFKETDLWEEVKKIQMEQHPSREKQLGGSKKQVTQEGALERKQ